MVGVGTLMLIVSWWGVFTIWRKKPIGKPLLTIMSVMTFSGWVAVLSGWYVTEIGRQPYIVYGALTTADVVADHPAGMLLSTLIAYALIYIFLLISYIMTIRYMATKLARSQTMIHGYHDKSTQLTGEKA